MRRRPNDCPRCNGTGEIKRRGENAWRAPTVCLSCGGTGTRSVEVEGSSASKPATSPTEPIAVAQGLTDATREVEAVPTLNGTRENYEARTALFDGWRKAPEAAPDWFALVDALDDAPWLEDATAPYPMTEETFDKTDLRAVRKMAATMPHVMCDEFDSLGGDSVDGAVMGLLTDKGSERIDMMRKIVQLARELAEKRGWR